MTQEKFIDIEKTLRTKNPGLLNKMPKFILNYIKRTLHEDEMNEIVETRTHLFGADFCESILNRFELKVHIHGKENIPESCGCIIVSNHTRGGMDALALIQEIAKVRTDFRFIVNDVLLQIKNLADTFIGVNKYGKNSAESLQGIANLYASDQATLLFPAGLVSRRTKGKVKDLKWKKTFVSRAKRHNKPVIPVYIDGQLSNFFYNLSNIRTKLGIKANIELFYLSDEQFRQMGGEINIYVGKAISADVFDKSKTDLEWAQWVKEEVYSTLDPKSK